MPDLIAPAYRANRLALALDKLHEYQRTDTPSRRFVKDVTHSIEKMEEAVVAMINDCKAMAQDSSASMGTAVHKVQTYFIWTCRHVKRAASDLPDIAELEGWDAETTIANAALMADLNFDGDA